jgi:hypothetical protein
MTKKAKSTGNSFTAQLGRFNSNLWHFHIMVPDNVSKKFLEDGNKRVVCTLNGKIEFQCALMPAGDGAYFINLNQKIRDTLNLKIGSEVEVSLVNDESQYGLPMPEEFNELLRMDDEGNALFHALTPGKQRTLLHIIGTPKNADSRIRRAICVVNHLKDTRGKINYKILNELIKNSR